MFKILFNIITGEYFKLYGGGKGGGPPAPNAGMIAQAEAAAAAAASQEKISTRILDFTEKQYEENLPYMTQIAEYQMAMLKSQAEAGEDSSKFAREILMPFQKEMVDQARAFKGEEFAEAQAQKFKGDFQVASANIADQRRREAAARGISLDSKRFQTINANLQRDQALDLAFGMNKARDAGRQEAYAKQLDALSIMKGLPAQATAQFGSGSDIGVQGVGVRSAAGQSFLTGADASSVALGRSAKARAFSGDIYGKEYSGRLDAYKQREQSGQAFGQNLGTLAAVGMRYGAFGPAGLGIPSSTPGIFGKDGGSIKKGIQGVIKDGKMSSNGLKGGLVEGPGGPRDDKVTAVHTNTQIPIRLSDDEYIIKASSVKKYGLTAMDKINKGLVSKSDMNKAIKA